MEEAAVEVPGKLRINLPRRGSPVNQGAKTSLKQLIDAPHVPGGRLHLDNIGQ